MHNLSNVVETCDIFKLIFTLSVFIIIIVRESSGRIFKFRLDSAV
nr:MAG TPA: hypothetical protein [Caudoviricetes sp.]